MIFFANLMDFHQQQLNRLNTNFWFTNYQCSKEISYIPMGGSLIINVLVYTHNRGSPVMSSVGLKPNICGWPNNHYGSLTVEYVWVYTPSVLPKTTQDMVYTPMGGSPTINVMVHALFVVLPKLDVWAFTLVFIGNSNAKHMRLNI